MGKQCLTFPRSFATPFAPNTGAAITRFFQSSPRRWKHDANGSTVFLLKFFRGNWKQPRLVQWAPFLGKVLPSRVAGATQGRGPELVLELCPAELTVELKPQDRWCEIHLVYTVTFADRDKPIGQSERTKWRKAVDEDIERLNAALRADRQPASGKG